MKLSTILASLIVLSSTPAMAQVTCTITSKFGCGPQGCKQGTPTIVVRIDEERQQYSRCDAKGCDDYAALFSRSGMFLNIAMPKNGAMAKMTEDGSSFVEIVTVMDVPIICFGTCK